MQQLPHLCWSVDYAALFHIKFKARVNNLSKEVGHTGLYGAGVLPDEPHTGVRLDKSASSR